MVETRPHNSFSQFSGRTWQMSCIWESKTLLGATITMMVGS